MIGVFFIHLFAPSSYMYKTTICVLQVYMVVPFHQLGTENFMIVVIQHETSQSHGLPTTLLDGALLCTPVK